MKNITAFRSLLVAFFATAFSLSSCIKNDFDAPPGDGEDPNITATTTIAQLKQQYTGTPFQITDDVVIKGVIISSDKEGNFYKSLIIQDSTAGILIRVDQTNLYTEYPVGRRVFVKCKGLWVGDYENLIQMGGLLDSISDPQNPSVESIPTAVVGNYILKGKYNVPVTPTVVTIGQLNDSYQNMLIQLQDVEFDFTEVGTTYADAVTKFSKNKKVIDCNGGEVLLRTSGYANFAADSIPLNHGSLNAIYSVFRTDKQLYINTPADFQFQGNRCTGPGINNSVSISSIRILFTGSQVTLGTGKSIRGVVISDKNSGNFDSRNLVIQDNSGGIVVRFSSAHNFSLGDEVEVNISGQRLSEFNSLLEVEAPNANAAKVGTGNVVPQTVTIAQIVANLENYESELVTVENVTISGGSGNYSGTITMNDGTGTVNLYTRPAASFANSTYPAGVLTVTAVVSQFNSAQLNIRTTADVQQ
jgi:DNA/RNA endonuclease YhcR with UshA esterase domain